MQSFCAEAADPLACLREVPAAELVAWGSDAGIFGAGWAPTVVPESDILPAPPVALIEAGQYNQGPVIVGTNRNEWGLFQLIGAADSVADTAGLYQYIDGTYPPALATPLKALYAPPSDALANAKALRLPHMQGRRERTRGER